jgi:hypothetical protein
MIVAAAGVTVSGRGPHHPVLAMFGSIVPLKER